MEHRTKTPSEILHIVKRAIRDRYAWPGGYPLYILMYPGEAISCESAKKNWRSIVWSTLNHARDGWEEYDAAINWEDNNLCCSYSGKLIESAYGPDDESDNESDDES